MKKFVVLILLFYCFAVYAYRPRLVFNQDLTIDNPEKIQNPEIYQTFFGELDGKADYYKINSSDDFTLYFNILTPDTPDSLTDFSVDIYSENVHFSLDGNQFDWGGYFEKLTGNYYLKGPSYEEVLPQGEYLIQVSNSDNQGKYILVVGKNDPFSVPEAFNTFILMPKIKTFFEKSPLSAYFNQVGLVLFVIFIIILIIIVLIVYFRQYQKQIDYRWSNPSSVDPASYIH